MKCQIPRHLHHDDFHLNLPTFVAVQYYSLSNQIFNDIFTRADRINLIPLVLRQGLPKDLFPIGLPVKMLKGHVPFSILAIWHAHLNRLDFITFIILNERTNYEVSQEIKIILLEASDLPVDPFRRFATEKGLAGK